MDSMMLLAYFLVQAVLIGAESYGFRGRMWVFMGVLGPSPLFICPYARIGNLSDVNNITYSPIAVGASLTLAALSLWRSTCSQEHTPIGNNGTCIITESVHGDRKETEQKKSNGHPHSPDPHTPEGGRAADEATAQENSEDRAGLNRRERRDNRRTPRPAGQKDAPPVDGGGASKYKAV
jgi:hypothetical protein